MQQAPTARFSWVSGTSLGLEEVPLVCSTRHTSLRRQRPSPRALLASAPHAAAPVACTTPAR
eukprot:scaffold133658_cov30-Tisochrysis_lutea.AAC.2